MKKSIILKILLSIDIGICLSLIACEILKIALLEKNSSMNLNLIFIILFGIVILITLIAVFNIPKLIKIKSKKLN